MARYWHDGDPIEMEAVCDPQHTEQLVAFDHHLTYHWSLAAATDSTRIARVLFNPAPRHAPFEDQVRLIVRKHPEAPSEVQDLIDHLSFRLPTTSGGAGGPGQSPTVRKTPDHTA